MLACNCLNVVVESETGDFLKVTHSDDYKIISEQQRDSFFKMDLYRCTKIPDIKTHQTLLQSVRNVGDWQIYTCTNCNMQTHAVNKYKGLSSALFPTNLLTFQKIKELKASKHYSKCFNIILPEKIDKTSMKELHPVIIAELKSQEGNFIKQFHEFKDKERRTCQERINAYSDLQNALVDDLVELEEHFLEAMKWKFIEERNKQMLSDGVEEAMEITNTNWKESHSNVQTPLPLYLERQNSKKLPDIPGEIFDMEDMDGLDDSQPHSHSEDESAGEENDTVPNTNDNGVQIPRNRSNSMSIAKSLPISIPSFLSTHGPHANEESDSDSQEPGNVDIAASIKALARSVHGEAVFGELPRPRFSSQI